MAKHFSLKTFKYFDEAARHVMSKEWFETNKSLYLEHVRSPFAQVTDQIAKEFASDLPGIEISERKITRPLRPANRAAEQGWVKTHTHITLWQKKSSLFEWNPGIHLQIGHEKDDNSFGVGLYLVSGRQLRLMREGIVNDFEGFHGIVGSRKFKKNWGSLQGERYKRIPKGFERFVEKEEYLLCKQFYVSQQLSRKEVKDPNFADRIVEDLRIAMPFFKWIRQTVGTYKKGQK